MADRFNFKEVQQKLLQTRRELLVLLSNQAQDYFARSFKTGSFDGKPWKEVQRRTPGTPSYKYPKGRGLQRRTSPILVGAGAGVRGGTLLRQVATMARTAAISNNSLKMIVDSEYAGYHNDGTPRMVKRQFVGQTKELTAMQKTKINEVIMRIWQV